jgi:hypothetical protein
MNPENGRRATPSFDWSARARAAHVRFILGRARSYQELPNGIRQKTGGLDACAAMVRRWAARKGEPRRKAIRATKNNGRRMSNRLGETEQRRA